MQNINLQSKSHLAKLMAFENVWVSFDPTYDTASFNLETRELRVPILKDMTNYIYDWFIAHEVSHALYTPALEQWKHHTKEIPFAYINVTEDVRIEKAIQKRYPGTRKDCKLFYQDFAPNGRDFFSILTPPKDPEQAAHWTIMEKRSLIDRINLHFKLGQHKLITVPFSKEEQPFVDMCDKIETFDEAIEAARAIWEYEKEKKKDDPNFQKQMMEADGQGQGSSGEGGLDKVKVSSQDAFDKSFRDQMISKSEKSKVPAEMKDYKTEIMSNESKYINKTYFEKMANSSSRDLSYKYLEFVKQINPVVSMMIGIFNMKKAAKSYSQTSIAKTGKLDMDNLHSYKTTDDLFLRKEIVHNEQNHGFVFFLDWSASMGDKIEKTVSQLIILMEFARKTSIPFEVYGYTTKEIGNNVPKTNQLIGQEQDALIFKLISSNMPVAAFRKVCSDLMTDTGIPYKKRNTPLKTVGLYSTGIIAKFQASNRVHKVSTIVLSDGQENDAISNQNGYDTSTGKHHKLKTYHDVFAYAREKAGMWKTVGFYLPQNGTVSPSDFEHMTGKILPDDEIMALTKKHMKDGYVETSSNGFDKYFAINLNAFQNNDAVIDHDMEKLHGTIQKSKVDDLFRKKLASCGKSMIFMKIFVDLIS